MKRAVIQASIAHLDDREVLAIIDPMRLDAIRTQDPKPQIRAYVIGHEGEAQGRLVGAGTRVIEYMARAIRSLHDRLQIGTPVFRGHGVTNEHEGRRAIGEVVGKALKEINGRLSEVAAVWVRQEHASDPLDVASIEAEVEFRETGADRLEGVSVENITGIALGDSRTEAPGFPGATLLATVQAFVAGDEEAGEVKLTLEQVKRAVQENGWDPSTIFEPDDLKADRAVAHIIAEETKTATEAKRQIQERLGRKLDAKDEEISKLRGEVLRARTGTILDGLATERKLTEAQRAFVERRLERFKSEAENEDALKSDLNRYLDAELREFDDWAKLFGASQGGGNQGKNQDGGDGGSANPEAAGTQNGEAGTGAPAGDKSGSVGGDPYTDPSQNDFIA